MKSAFPLDHPLRACPALAATAPAKQPVVSPVRAVLASQITVRVIPAIELRFAFCEMIDAIVPAVRDLADLATGHQKQQNDAREAVENSVHGEVRSHPDEGSRDSTHGVDRASRNSVVASTAREFDSSVHFENAVSREENASTSRQGPRRFPTHAAIWKHLPSLCSGRLSSVKLAWPHSAGARWPEDTSQPEPLSVFAADEDLASGHADSHGIL
jgi:hypothetical protein